MKKIRIKVKKLADLESEKDSTNHMKIFLTLNTTGELLPKNN
jgi:hypothetical protein